jgi:hypothetical protein
MATMPPLTISPVLREAAELKIDELNRAKETFKRHYHLDTGRLTEVDVVARVKSLLDDIKKLVPELENDDDLNTIAVYVEEAVDDRSISKSKLLKFEEQIRSKLVQQMHRLEVSSLHVELMKEVMDTDESAASVAVKLESADLDDDFEVVDNGRDEVLERFEKEAFTAREVDSVAIEVYLSSIFADSEDKQGLEDIRSELQAFGEEVITDGLEIEQDFLMWCIMDLLKKDVLDDKKTKTLEGYVQSPIALRELVATLNTKPVHHWNYKNTDNGLPVTTYKNVEGQYCVSVEENTIDLLFLHCMGIGWAMKLKDSVVDFVRSWNSGNTKGLSVDETNKREYFLGRKPPMPVTVLCSVCNSTIPPHSRTYPCSLPPPPPPVDYPGPPPPPPPPPPPMIICKASKKKWKRNRSWAPSPYLIPAVSNLAETRKSSYIRDFFMSRLPIQEGCTPKVAPPEYVQANMIKRLAVETKLREAFDGRSYASSVYFRSLASSLPHKTILTVLKFLGVPETFLEFFGHFLSAKLNIGPAVRGGPERILPRARGVQGGHALEMFFTEAVMFFLEIVVQKKTGSYLYRLKDSCYFVGNFEQHQAYKAEVAQFTSVMGLEINAGQAQSIGLLSIDTHGTTIKEYKIGAYAHRIKKQLDDCTTVLDWVRVWNSTAGTYAAHLFGPPAFVLGKPHLEAVKKAYSLIFDIIFDGGNLTAHVKHLLTTHLKTNLNDPAFSLEALIYLPQAYGGLGVKNPFVTLSLVDMGEGDPDSKIKDYFDVEDNYYKRAAENYALLPPEARNQKLEIIFLNDTARINASLGAGRDLTVFMTKDELTAHRERATYPNLPYPPLPPPFIRTVVPSLPSLYSELFAELHKDVPYSDKVSDEVDRLSGKGDMRSSYKLSAEDKWVLQLYGDECFERYGGLEVWYGEHVPQEVLKVVRGASWDDGDGDDSSSISDVTEP